MSIYTDDTSYVQVLPAGIDDYNSQGCQFDVNGIQYIGTVMVGSSWWLAYALDDPFRIIRLIYQPEDNTDPNPTTP